MKEKLHIAVACGGTGGHIFPGLATAHALRAHGHHAVLWLAGKGGEDRAVEGWKGPVVTVPAEGFQFGPLRSVLTVVRIVMAVFRCWIGMLRHRPDVVLAMGSYASIGPCLAARLSGTPYILHEANAMPGRAIRLLARRAAAIAICFEETRYHLKNSSAVTVGMPLRPELLAGGKVPPVSGAGKQERQTFHLLIMGGSGGAHAINTLVPEAVCSLAANHSGPSRLQITHLTGPADDAAVARHYREAGVQADVRAFTHDMADLYRTASLAICRAGASTCAELTCFAVPSLLIPYPHAAADHQTANAHALEKAGAADLIQQADLTIDWLVDYIRTQIENPGRIERMRRSAAERAPDKNAADALVDLIEQTIKARRVSP